jgi:hypothetical protein
VLQLWDFDFSKQDVCGIDGIWMKQIVYDNIIKCEAWLKSCNKCDFMATLCRLTCLFVFMPRNPLDQAVRFVMLEWCSHIVIVPFITFYITFCMWLYALVCCYLSPLFPWPVLFTLFIDVLLRNNNNNSNNALKFHILL